MFEFSKIDKDLTIYKNNDVIIFGASSAGLRVKHMLEVHDVEIIAFVDNDNDKAGKRLEKVKIISFAECLEYVQKHKNTIIQIGSTYEQEISKQLLRADINNFIWYSEFNDRIGALNLYIRSQKDPNFTCSYVEQWKNIKMKLICLNTTDYFSDISQFTKTILLALSPLKVGNNTLGASLHQMGLNMMPTYHSYVFIDNYLEKCFSTTSQLMIKLIIGVRDPVRQNISMLYQLLGGGEKSYYDLEEYWRDGGDVQAIFNKMIHGFNKNCYRSKFIDIAKTDYLVQHYFEQQIEPFFGVDIYQYPFDKEKGYSVYHIHDKLEIMIYQLEKMNSLETEIGDFLKVKDFKLIKANDSANKWYSESYKNVVKNMPLEKEYVEECYLSKYIKHFYSDEDIAKFKVQWKIKE